MRIVDRPTPRRRPAAFTLVELLVVIGIIALLIGILLPTLSRARAAAQRTACAAKLQQIMLAAEMCQQAHHGFYPLMGIIPGRAPESLDDPYCQNYSYLSPTATVSGVNSGSYVPRELAPLSDSLSVYMGFGQQILVRVNASAVNNMYDPSGFIRNFICPSQATAFGDIAPVSSPANSCVLSPTDGTASYYEPQSYVYNEYVLGWDDTYARLRGRVNQIRKPYETMFACDGLHGKSGAEVSGVATFTLWNIAVPKPKQQSLSVGDAFQASPTAPTASTLAYDPACFDKARHYGKINVAFCDGHVETRTLNYGDLSTVYLFAP